MKTSKYINDRIEDFLLQKTEPTMRSEALKYAYAMRDTLDNGYWTRAAYFWAFLGAAFAGYATAFTTLDDKPDKQIFLLLIISSIGFLLSWAWYLANRGSKYWMVHWERKIRSLQNEVTGPLFGGDKIDDDSKGWALWDSYPFPVTKINCLISFYAWVLWLFIGIYTVYSAHVIIPCWAIWSLVLLTLVGWELLRCSRIDQDSGN